MTLFKGVTAYLHKAAGELAAPVMNRLEFPLKVNVIQGVLGAYEVVNSDSSSPPMMS
jgi:hypothetical protein